MKLEIIAIVLFVCLNIAACDRYKDSFDAYTKKFNHTVGKKKNSTQRFNHYKKNLDRANLLNNKYKTAQFGDTKFSDSDFDANLKPFTGAQVLINNNGIRAAAKKTTTTKKTTTKRIATTKKVATTTSKPSTTTTTKGTVTSLDWRASGIVTSVKDQSQCGSCWAFASNAAVESQYLKNRKSLLDLSEQNLVDCVTLNDGCNGGAIEYAFGYIKSGVMNEARYPVNFSNSHLFQIKNFKMIQILSILL
jgi:C1A family cysteine protease